MASMRYMVRPPINNPPIGFSKWEPEECMVCKKDPIGNKSLAWYARHLRAINDTDIVLAQAMLKRFSGLEG